jgi:prolyl-tRNA synthetase
MGCYGIGVTRLPAAAIEQRYDDKGIVWPKSIAPFEVVITPLGYLRSENVRSAAIALYDQLMVAGIDVILDDRDERPGAMFADWELIGVPLRVTIGERGLKDGQVELTVRRGMSMTLAPLAGAAQAVKDLLQTC